MAYTVVRFLEENEEEEEIISEVPSSWIESDHSWWPSSKNVSSLISKGVCPDKNKWRKYPVTILGVADDYHKARWKADHVESDSSSSEKGRGKRKKKVKNIEPNNDGTSDEDDIKEKVMSKLPEYPGIESSFQSEISHQFEESDDNLDHRSENGNSVQLVVDSGSEEYGMVHTESAIEDAIDMTIINVSTDQLINELRTYVKEEFIKTNRMLANILLELQSLNTTGRTIHLNFEDDDVQSIISSFPIDDIDVLKEIDGRVERDQQSYKKVVLYFKSIGGITLKEKICRILRRAFSNKLIAQASWLGHSRGDRKNFQLSNLKLIAAIKDAVNTDMTYTEKEFEKITADWTRQGKQRKQRERKNDE